MDKFSLKLLSTVAIGGVLHRAGSIVDLAERDATDLLRRGRAEPAVSAPDELLEADLEEAVSDKTQEGDKEPESDKQPEGSKEPEGDKGPESAQEKSDDSAGKPGKKAK